jgi:hypothetical protein
MPTGSFENYGKVSVLSTVIDVMLDFLVVDTSHHYITEDRLGIETTRSILMTCAFLGASQQADL